jgi:hypothetical protein
MNILADIPGIGKITEDSGFVSLKECSDKQYQSTHLLDIFSVYFPDAVYVI